MSTALSSRVMAEVRAEMGRQNLSRRQLAEKVGEPHVTVSRWVKGETRVGLDEIDALAEALGIGVGELLRRASVIDLRGPEGDDYAPTTRGYAADDVAADLRDSTRPEPALNWAA